MTIWMFRFSVYMGIRANDIIGVRLYMGKFIKFLMDIKIKKESSFVTNKNYLNQ